MPENLRHMQLIGRVSKAVGADRVSRVAPWEKLSICEFLGWFVSLWTIYICMVAYVVLSGILRDMGNGGESLLTHWGRQRQCCLGEFSKMGFPRPPVSQPPRRSQEQHSFPQAPQNVQVFRKCTAQLPQSHLQCGIEGRRKRDFRWPRHAEQQVRPAGKKKMRTLPHNPVAKGGVDSVVCMYQYVPELHRMCLSGGGHQISGPFYDSLILSRESSSGMCPNGV